MCFIDGRHEKNPKGRCDQCKYARVVVASNQWEFIGCYCHPYKGKWVAEIKDCPKIKDGD